MTVFDTAAYLVEAIESVLSQQIEPGHPTITWELLIVDDGSTDGSFEIALAYANRYSDSIRLLRHDAARNRGISRSRNLALENARGSLLAFLDSDDVWLPHHLQTLVRAIWGNAEAAMVYGSAERWVDFAEPFDETSARNSDWGSNFLPPLVPRGQRAGLLSSGLLVQWFRADESLVPCICSVVVRTQAARQVGGFCNAFRGLYDDQAFHAKISLRFPVLALDRCVARYRQHPHSCCSIARRHPQKQAREQRRFQAFLSTELHSMRTVEAAETTG